MDVKLKEVLDYVESEIAKYEKKKEENNQDIDIKLICSVVLVSLENIKTRILF